MADDPHNQQQFVKDALAATGQDINFGDGKGNVKVPTEKDIMELMKQMEQMKGIIDDKHESIKKSLHSSDDDYVQELLKSYTKQTGRNTSRDYMIFTAMIVILLLIFALFGYKLYKSLMQKKLRKQEKLKLKLSKKSKKIN